MLDMQLSVYNNTKIYLKYIWCSYGTQMQVFKDKSSDCCGLVAEYDYMRDDFMVMRRKEVYIWHLSLKMHLLAT